MLKKDRANLLFRGDVQVSSMLILRNSKSLLGIPIKILFVVSVLSGARSHSVRYRVQDLYVQLFQLKNNVFERSFQILLIVFPSTNAFFFFSLPIFRQNHPPKELWNERSPLCPLLMKICRSINTKQGWSPLFSLFPLFLSLYVSLWRCFTRYEKKKKRVKKNTWKFIIQGRGNVKSDEWMFSRFFFYYGWTLFLCFLYIVIFFFFFSRN